MVGGEQSGVVRKGCSAVNPIPPPKASPAPRPSDERSPQVPVASSYAVPRAIIAGVFLPSFALRRRTCTCAVLLLLASPATSIRPASVAQSADDARYAELSGGLARLAPQTIHPAEGYDPATPISFRRAITSRCGIGMDTSSECTGQIRIAEDAKYLRDWALGFASSADADGYVAGCITPKGHGRFSESLR